MEKKKEMMKMKEYEMLYIKRWESLKHFVLWKNKEMFTINKGVIIYTEDYGFDLLHTLWYNGFIKPDGVNVLLERG